MHFRTQPPLLSAVAVLLFAPITLVTSAQQPNPVTPPGQQDVRDELPSELASAMNHFVLDRGSLERFYNIPSSAARRERMEEFYTEWLQRLEDYDFDALSQEGRIDWLLFRNHLQKQLKQLQIAAARAGEVEPLLPFGSNIVGLEEARRKMEWVEPFRAASDLEELREAITQAQDRVQAMLTDSATLPKRTVAWRAAGWADDYRRRLKAWFDFYNGYDPMFTWWAAESYERVDEELGQYAEYLRTKVVGVEKDADALIGDPIGSDALMVELQYEMIPYSPEQLVDIAEQEYAWCEAEMNRAAAELGYDDWHDALEHVKGLYVDPGKQPELIRQLAWEAIEFVEQRELLTVPDLAKSTWRMEMMSPERQLQNPFFLGGEVIQVSYPTHTMAHEAKLMSLRGNNPHFARATVHHELIPGHHLQGFMTRRYRPYRRPFGTPFWLEGWALYWEMLLWDLDFPRSPEDRIGMLFWRMHRCARIVFSLSFHLETMTPREAVDYLVEKVGHERANAEAEVRRSIAGNYGPLYQIAYMIGGLQFRELYRDLVERGRLTDRQFHDAILRGNSMPVELVRASLIEQELSPEFHSQWLFYDQLER
jgi:uncharacterized protein (DUF885 family)